MRFYFPITKVDAEAHMVWGYASTEAPDDQGEIVTREALTAALAEYMKFANIREMHQLSAVGRAQEAGVDDKGLYVGAVVVDGPAWAKVKAGVYNGFSIGGRVTARDPADRKVITGLALNEISLVDRPANPEAVFDCWKGLAPASRQPQQIWHCGADEHRHAAKAEALQCIAKSGGADAPMPTEGTTAFADPGYRADGRRRYPLDSAEHIRAAWAHIHVTANAAPYSAAHLAQIKQRIAAAWRAIIDPHGPPSTRSGTVRKGLCEVARLAELIDALAVLQTEVADEAVAEGDGSPLPTRLQAVVAELCDLLNAMTVEETAEIDTGTAAPQPEDFVTLAASPVGRGDGDAVLAKALAQIVPRLDRLAQRVEAIAATPLPPLTRAGAGLHTLSKRADSGGDETDVVAVLARMSGEERTLALIKAAHANPLRPFDR